MKRIIIAVLAAIALSFGVYTYNSVQAVQPCSTTLADPIDGCG